MLFLLKIIVYFFIFIFYLFFYSSNEVAEDVSIESNFMW
jgi:hypothetical protein